MNAYHLIKTLPGEPNFNLFEQLPATLYPTDSPRFLLGHDPVATHLEGCYVLLNGKQPVGRFAFYDNPELTYQGKPAGCVGSYECIQDPIVSQILLHHVKLIASEKDYAWVIGPMEGSTWNTYRFCKQNDEPSFFTEPYHHDYYNQQFHDAGFVTIAEYQSNVDQTLQFEAAPLLAYEQTCEAQGVTFRALNFDDLETDLLKIARFSLEAFASNFLFTPTQPEGVVARYLKLKHLFDPDLIQLVEDAKGNLQAFTFSVQDHFDPSGKTIIIKSMARKADSTIRGLGHYLAKKTSLIAKKKGFSRVIHALMRNENCSRTFSEQYGGGRYKSYALYATAV